MENVLWNYTSYIPCCVQVFAGENGENVLNAIAQQKQLQAGEDGEWHSG